ncbi:MAG: response regulator [Verrucomicrobiia bacterium]
MIEKTKILLVEKDIPAAMMLVHGLTSAGCDVRVAPTARKGMHLAQTTHFDLVVLDLDLPDLENLDLEGELQQLRTVNPAPVIFISQHASEAERQCSLALGAVEYLAKSSGAQEFIRRILAHANARNASTDTTPIAAT